VVECSSWCAASVLTPQLNYCCRVAVCAGFGTKPQSINTDGTITGWFEDANVVHHGFVSDHPYTTLTTFDAPGACSSGPACARAGTFSYGNDAVGRIVGYAVDLAGARHGFVGHQDE
jgi:hypothetical protein